MTRNALLLVLFASTVVAGLAYADGLKLQPGLWRFQPSMKMDGAAFGNPQSFDKCMTDADTKDPTSAVKLPPGCSMANAKPTANGYHWQAQCHMNGGSQAGDGTLTYSNGTLNVDMTLVMDDPKAGKHTMVTHTEAHRVGDCK